MIMSLNPRSIDSTVCFVCQQTMVGVLLLFCLLAPIIRVEARNIDVPAPVAASYAAGAAVKEESTETAKAADGEAKEPRIGKSSSSPFYNFNQLAHCDVLNRDMYSCIRLDLPS